MNIMKQITTPILFLVFNRPEKTRLVFECIRKAKPQKLYVAIDAPRKDRNDDINNCNEVKKIVHNVDWPCETHYLEHEKNLGCSLAGKTAWDWFFANEEEMIFLEDDGLVTDSFFWYCQELLEKYRNDERVGYIGAVNFGQTFGDKTYFFSRCSISTYAMATWKRVYDLYDYDLSSYAQTRNTKDFQSNFRNALERNTYLSLFDNYVKSLSIGKRQNTYDLQMVYLVLKYHKICIYPNINQVTNIGFDFNGSNTGMDPNSKTAKEHTRPRYEINEIIHPLDVEIDNNFEKVVFQHRLLGGKSYTKAWISYFVSLTGLPFLFKKIRIRLSNVKFIKSIYFKLFK